MTGSPTWNPEISPATPSPNSWVTDGVYFRSDAQGIHLHLPSTLPWEELWENLVWQLRSRKPYWAGVAPLTLWSQQRELDMPALQLLAALLSQHGLQLWRVQTRSRSTAIAAATLGYSVEQSSLLEAVPPAPPDTTPLYLRSTVRSGMSVRHRGSVFLLGDLNPGGEIIAGGDIWVWGRLRGLVHAGADGDKGAVILALQLEPTQLRIADQVARPPEGGSLPNTPEVVYLQEDVICVASLQDFLRRGV
ncbi:septum site-determining protein MinC [Synechococcus sp. W55.1]|uniref:septum site-determining protein MinC n=1 Tax=Synechococcus sp. W55.1 TaxID=2964512 RepID=UPI0039C363A7